MSDEQNVAGGGVERRVHPRVPVETRVRVEYGSLRGFVEEVCRNVSIGGMFIECLEPPDLGTQLRFVLQLPAPVSRQVQGAGDVVWRRAPADSDGPRPGFGVRFTELPATDQRLIFRIVDHYVQRGGDPFDIAAD
jgi:uncharacterized protein (TIGR02266 family)